MSKRTSVTMTAGFAVAVAFASPGVGQSSGPSHAGYDPTVSVEGHFHEGELGDKLMILESALKCDCGCGLDIHSCQFQMQCGTSPVWSLRIREALAAGESVDAIQASFVADFGTQVLMMPPVEGFNLFGYFLPAIAIVTGGMLIGLVARGGLQREALAPIEHLSAEDEARLLVAMQKLDAEQSPDW